MLSTFVIFRTKKILAKSKGHAASYNRMYCQCQGWMLCLYCFKYASDGQFYTVKIFILELFLTRENMKKRVTTQQANKRHCHWIWACKVLLFKYKCYVGIETLFQIFNTIYSKWK